MTVLSQKRELKARFSSEIFTAHILPGHQQIKKLGIYVKLSKLADSRVCFRLQKVQVIIGLRFKTMNLSVNCVFGIELIACTKFTQK